MKALGDFVLVKVDRDANPELVDRFGVGGIPDVRFLDAEGRPLGRVLGFRPAAAMAAAVRAAAAAAGR